MSIESVSIFEENVTSLDDLVTLDDLITSSDIHNSDDLVIRSEYSGVLTKEVVQALEISIGVLGIITNLKVILVMCSDVKLFKSRTNVYMTSQSVIDVMVALFTILITQIGSKGRYLHTFSDKVGLFFSLLFHGS